MPSENPFALPPSATPPQIAYPVDQFPKFSLVVLIVDLAMRTLRMLMVVLSIMGVVAMGQGNPMHFWGILEIVTGLLMVVFGLSGDVLVLTKQRWGLYLCWIAALASIASILVGLCEVPLIWEAQLNGGRLPPGQENAVKIGMWVGAIMTALLRMGLTIVYCIALSIAKRYFDRRSQA